MTAALPQPFVRRPPSSEQLVDLFQELRLQLGMSPSPACARNAASRLRPHAHTDAWQDEIVAAASLAELAASPVYCTLEEARQLVGPTSPLVVRGADGLLILHQKVLGGVRAWSARTGQSEVLSLKALARVVGVNSPKDEWAFVTVDRTLYYNVDDQGPDDHSPPKRMLRLLRPEREDLAVIVVYAAAVGILSLVVPVTVQALVNTVAFGTVLLPLLILALLVLFFTGLSASLKAMQHYVGELIQRRLFVRVLNDVAYRLPRASRDAFAKSNSLDLTNRIFDLFSVQKSAATLMLDGVSVVLSVATGTILLAFYHPYLLAFSIVLVLGMLAIAFIGGRGAISTAYKESALKYQVASALDEMGMSVTTFANAGGRAFARNRIDDLATKYIDARRNHFRVVFRQSVSALATQAIAGTLVLGLGGWLVIERQLTLGQLVAAELVVAVTTAALARAGKLFETYYDLAIAAGKVGDLIDLPIESEGGLPFPREATGPTGVELQNVSVQLDNESQLQPLSITIEPGEHLSIYGPSDSGKGTLGQLLFGRVKPSAGTVRIDNVDLAGLSNAALRERVAFVDDPLVATGTLLDNLRFGREEILLANVETVIDRLGMGPLVNRLPDGLATKLGVGGAALSHKERARIALARALLGEPKLLVVERLLDAFDTVDPIFDALDGLTERMTLIVITSNRTIANRYRRRLCIDEGMIASDTAGSLLPQEVR